MAMSESCSEVVAATAAMSRNTERSVKDIKTIVERSRVTVEKSRHLLKRLEKTPREDHTLEAVSKIHGNNAPNA